MEPRARSDRADTSVGPNVFISYRVADTAVLIDRLAEDLRNDLGSRSVFRDRDSLIGGQPWQQVIDDSIGVSDVALFVVGPNWTGQDDHGRRIDETDDPVRREVEVALTSSATPVPVLVDLPGPPDDLDDGPRRLFEHHAIRATRDGLADPESEDYQAILVGIWESMRHRVPNGVLVFSEAEAEIELSALVAELHESKLVDARKLSRLAAGVHVVPGRRMRKWAKRLPDVIVLTESAPSATLRSRISVAAKHPGLQKVAFLGAGVAAGLGVAAATAAGSGSRVALTAHSNASDLAGMGGSPIRGAIGTAARRWTTAGLVTKTTVAACAAAAGTVGAVAVNPFGGGITVGATVHYGYLEVTLDSVDVHRPQPTPGDETATAEEPDDPLAGVWANIGISPEDLEPDEQLVVVGVTVDETSEAIDWRIDTTDVFHLEVGDELYHVAENERIELAAARSEQAAMGFVVPTETEAGDARFVVQEHPRDADRRTRPAYLGFDGSSSFGIDVINLDNIDNRSTQPGFCLARIALDSVIVGESAGFRANGGPLWESAQGRLARPLEGRLFVTIIGNGTRDTDSQACSVSSQRTFRPVLLDSDGTLREAVSDRHTVFSNWSRQPTPWIWTFEVDESLEEFEFTIPSFDDFEFSASLDGG